MSLSATFIFGSIFLLITLLLFFLLRQIMLWYWKVDDRVDLLKSQAESLKSIAEQSQKQTDLLHLIFSASVDGKKIALTNKLTGGVKFISPSELKNYSLNGHEVTFITPKPAVS